MTLLNAGIDTTVIAPWLGHAGRVLEPKNLRAAVIRHGADPRAGIGFGKGRLAL